MNWPFVIGCLFIVGAVAVWLAISWRHPDRRSGRDPDDWQRIAGGGSGGGIDGSSH